MLFKRENPSIETRAENKSNPQFWPKPQQLHHAKTMGFALPGIFPRYPSNPSSPNLQTS